MNKPDLAKLKKDLLKLVATDPEMRVLAKYLVHEDSRDVDSFEVQGRTRSAKKRNFVFDESTALKFIEAVAASGAGKIVRKVNSTSVELFNSPEGWISWRSVGMAMQGRGEIWLTKMRADRKHNKQRQRPSELSPHPVDGGSGVFILQRTEGKEELVDVTNMSSSLVSDILLGLKSGLKGKS